MKVIHDYCTCLQVDCLPHLSWDAPSVWVSSFSFVQSPPVASAAADFPFWLLYWPPEVAWSQPGNMNIVREEWLVMVCNGKAHSIPSVQLSIKVNVFVQTFTRSCWSFIRSPLCFFLMGGILSSSPLSLSLFFWCSSQASSALVFSLRAFWRRCSKALSCCSLTCLSFMYWCTMSIVNCEKLSSPLEKARFVSWDYKGEKAEVSQR